MKTIDEIRNDFPILNSKKGYNNIIYLDNAATTQIPTVVMDCITEHYCSDNANIHRGTHFLSEKSTQKYENARKTVQKFINASNESEIIFTHGTTESINIIANGYRNLISKKDCIVITEMEHNSNILPWQRLCDITGAKLLICPCPGGFPDLEKFKELLASKPAIVAITHISNLTGIMFPVKEMTKMAHEVGADVIIDGAQGILHSNVDVQELDCDYYCFSGHKILGPHGIGVLYGKYKNLEQIEPLILGGGIVSSVYSDHFTINEIPNRFEAGTPNIIGAIGLGCALDYINGIGRDDIIKYEETLSCYLTDKIKRFTSVHILGDTTSGNKIVSFVVDGWHAQDFSHMLDHYGIATRSGALCVQLALESFGVEYAVRISPAFYNTFEEIDYTISIMKRILDI